MDYKIKFSDLYYLAWVPGVLEVSDPYQISGRLILLLDTSGNIYSTRGVYDDYAVKQTISNLPCEIDDFELILLKLDKDGHLAQLDVLTFTTTGYSIPPLQSNSIHLTLDQEWYDLLYGGNSNKVLRTLATGQSDITRHEAYTKATGLNEFNSLTPVYNSSANLEELMNQISEILSEYEISLSDLCVSSTWYNNKSCGILSITQNWTKIVSNELPPQVMIFSGEFTDDDKLNAKLFEGFDKVTSSSNLVSISKEDAIKLADLVIKACKQGYRLRILVK